MICPRCNKSTLPDHGLLLNETCCWRCVGIDELVAEIDRLTKQLEFSEMCGERVLSNIEWNITKATVQNTRLALERDMHLLDAREFRAKLADARKLITSTRWNDVDFNELLKMVSFTDEHPVVPSTNRTKLLSAILRDARMQKSKGATPEPDKESLTVELTALDSKLADIPKIKKIQFNEDAVPEPSTEKTDTQKRQNLVEKNCQNCGNSDHDEIGRIFCSIRSGMICYQREDRNKLLSPFVMTNWKLKDAAPANGDENE